MTKYRVSKKSPNKTNGLDETSILSNSLINFLDMTENSQLGICYTMDFSSLYLKTLYHWSIYKILHSDWSGHWRGNKLDLVPETSFDDKINKPICYSVQLDIAKLSSSWKFHWNWAKLALVLINTTHPPPPGKVPNQT